MSRCGFASVFGLCKFHDHDGRLFRRVECRSYAICRERGADADEGQGNPGLQDKVRKSLADLFGDSPQHIRVPEGAGLTAGGLYLGNLVQEGEGADAKIYQIYEDPGYSSPTKLAVSDIGHAEPQAGGYAIYRKNCLHCHGVSGAGDGPTAPFLYPSPAIIARESSSSRRRPAVRSRPATICAGRSRTACTARRCRRSTPS